MGSLGRLARETAVYGLSSIAGRFLNYLLVPLYTYKISAASGGYGVITNIYAYVALMMVILTYGMETTFFRFANKSGEDSPRVYQAALSLVGATSLLFILSVTVCLGPLSRLMGYPSHPDFVEVMAVCVAIDAFQAIPFAYLRYRKRAVKFASLKLLNIFLNISLNLIYFVLLPSIDANPLGILGDDGSTYNVGVVFYINLFCSASLFLFLFPELRGRRPLYDVPLMKRMLSYAWPILVFGIAGILNQTADKILFPWLYRGGDAHAQLGIYGAASKIAMIMAMITQAFRYAYEPFVFGGAEGKDSRSTQAKAMKYFLIFTLLAFLCVVGYMDILRYIIRRDYWSGLRVVPIVMGAEIMMGVAFNLSFWYKLTDRTIFGAVFSGIGCAVLVTVNILFVPVCGYMACAWGGFAGYATAMVLSYAVSRRYYPIAYPLKEMLFYVAAAMALTVVMTAVNRMASVPAALSVNTLCVLCFAWLIISREITFRALCSFINRRRGLSR